MLVDLTISNFAIIDHLNLPLAPGFSVLTGETGAGKSIIIDAMSLLLGARGETESIRTEADQARVEGIFTLDEAQRHDLAPLLEEYGLEDGGQLILTRVINRSGRNVCRINGRAVTLRIFQQIGQYLVDIHGQGDHLSLLRVREHVDILDRYGGLLERRAEVAAVVRDLRQVRREMERLRQDERELARRIDLLEYQVGEITAAQLRPGEEEKLDQERKRLANAEKLMTQSDAAYRALYDGNEHRPSAVDILDQVARTLTALEALDSSLAQCRQTAEEISYQVEDLGRSMREYRDSIEFNPSRLSQVEERLDLIYNLKRKYGDSVEEVLAFADKAAEELQTISHSEERLQELEEQEQALLGQLGRLAGELSVARRRVAEELATAVERELEELAMDGARFCVAITQDEVEDGVEVFVQADEAGVEAEAVSRRFAFDATGIDRVEFLISPNVGEPLKPLAKIASGGETSRLMLAMKSVLSHADEVPTLIFDEIDVGIGGRVGKIVGRKLWGLSSDHQVLCVTHLPQIACFVDAHYQVSKKITGGRTVTVVQPLAAEERVEELSQMLGSTSQVTRQKAIEMLEQTEHWKLSINSRQ